jgi:hypothetical protein
MTSGARPPSAPPPKVGGEEAPDGTVLAPSVESFLAALRRGDVDHRRWQATIAQLRPPDIQRTADLLSADLQFAGPVAALRAHAAVRRRLYELAIDAFGAAERAGWQTSYDRFVLVQALSSSLPRCMIQRQKEHVNLSTL